MIPQNDTHTGKTNSSPNILGNRVVFAALLLICAFISDVLLSYSHATQIAIIEINADADTSMPEFNELKENLNLKHESHIKYYKAELSSDSYLIFFRVNNEEYCYDDNCLISMIYRTQGKVSRFYVYAKKTLRIWNDYNPKRDGNLFGVIEFDVGRDLNRQFIQIEVNDFSIFVRAPL